MNSQLPLQSLLSGRELQYGLVIGAVAVLVLLLLRRHPTQRTMAFYLGGALLAYFGAPLLETALTMIGVTAAAPENITLSEGVLLRSAAVGGLTVALGVLLMARAWRESPER